MQKCKKCNGKITYRKAMKGFLNYFTPITCEECGTEHYISFATRFINAILVTIPLIFRVFGHDIFRNVGQIGSIGLYIVYITVIELLIPLFAGYYTK